MHEENHTLGDFGENIAVEFLKKRGFRILDRNIYFRFGEIDIAALQGDKLIFFEVKTRTNFVHGGAIHAFTKRKFERFRKAAFLYCQKQCIRSPFRVDFLAVQIDLQKKTAQVHHFKNISWHAFGLG